MVFGDLEVHLRGNYRWGFQNQEMDNEIKGTGNSIDFGARMYDSRLGRWMACDPKGAKYPGWSPYHFGYCSPIITIDPNGEENIVLIGSSSNDQPADWVKRPSLLAAGFNEAKKYAENFETTGEITTIVLLTKNYTEEELTIIRDKVSSTNGIQLLEVNSTNEAVMYIDTKGIDAERIENNDYSVSEERGNDLITHFSYFGHGGCNLLDVDPGPGGSISYCYGTPMKSKAFSEDSEANLVACYTASTCEDECGEISRTIDIWAKILIGKSVTGYDGVVKIGSDGSVNGKSVTIPGKNEDNNN